MAIFAVLSAMRHGGNYLQSGIFNLGSGIWYAESGFGGDEYLICRLQIPDFEVDFVFKIRYFLCSESGICSKKYLILNTKIPKYKSGLQNQFFCMVEVRQGMGM